MSGGSKKIWYFEEVDLYEILCPYKMADHLKTHPYDTYNKNDILFLPDEMAGEIYLVAEGKVKVGYYDDMGNELVKAYLGRGEILGELAYLGSGKRNEFAQAAENGTKICKMSAEKARELARDYVPFAFELNKRIAENVLRLERRLEILFFKDSRRRLLELLKDLRHMYPPRNIANPWIEHGLTQQELASLIGTSRKTVSLLLNELEKEEILKLAWGKFKILKPQMVET